MDDQYTAVGATQDSRLILAYVLVLYYCDVYVVAKTKHFT